MSERVQIPMKAAAAAPARRLTHAPARVLQRQCSCGGSGGSTGECEQCKKKKLQRRAIDSGPEVAPPIVHRVLRSNGQPLDPQTRAFFEPRFGHDFSKVRVHDDAKAAESAQAVKAQAYTVGRNIVFARRPSLGSDAARALFAHELTHVVQQTPASEGPSALQIGRTDSPHEKEADQVAKAIVSNQAAGAPLVRSATPALQRQPDPTAADAKVGQPRYGAKRSMLSDNGASAPSKSDQGSTIKLAQVGGGADPSTPQSSGTASPCQFKITYNVQQSDCPEGYCGGHIRAFPTLICGSGDNCPPLAGLQLTETVTNDNGCAPGNPETGGGCEIHAAPGQPATCGTFGVGCLDDIMLCMNPANVHGQCIEKWHQRIGVGGMLAEEHDIIFALSRPNGHCTGTVRRT